MENTQHTGVGFSFYHQAVRYLHDQLSGDEKTEFERIILLSDRHWQVYVDIAKIWNITGDISVPVSDTDEQWGELLNRIRNEGEEPPKKTQYHADRNVYYRNQTGRSSTGSYIPFVAGIILLLFFIYIFEYKSSIRVPDAESIPEPVLMEIATAKAERASLRLSDGTAVVLNADSKLITPERFTENRRDVVLEGEAYFDVIHRDDNPFRVFAGNTITSVIGTRFNIRERNGSVQIVVEEGCVDVVEIQDEPEAEKHTIISAGEMANYVPHRGLGSLQSVHVEDYLAWRFGRVVFRETPLADVFEEIERIYDVRSVFIDPELARRKLTGQFLREQLDDILQDIALAMDIQIERHGKTIKVYR